MTSTGGYKLGDNQRSERAGLLGGCQQRPQVVPPPQQPYSELEAMVGVEEGCRVTLIVYPRVSTPG